MSGRRDRSASTSFVSGGTLIRLVFPTLVFLGMFELIEQLADFVQFRGG
jgi:hypothetical protein